MGPYFDAEPGERDASPTKGNIPDMKIAVDGDYEPTDEMGRISFFTQEEVPSGEFHFLFSDPMPREIMRIRRMPDGKFSLIVQGELYAAAVEFWDCLKKHVEGLEGGTVEVSYVSSQV